MARRTGNTPKPGELDRTSTAPGGMPLLAHIEVKETLSADPILANGIRRAERGTRPIILPTVVRFPKTHRRRSCTRDEPSLALGSRIRDDVLKMSREPSIGATRGKFEEIDGGVADAVNAAPSVRNHPQEVEWVTPWECRHWPRWKRRGAMAIRDVGVPEDPH